MVGNGQQNIPPELSQPNPANPAVSVVAGQYHSVVITKNGSVLAFGYNNCGQTDTRPLVGKRAVAAAAAFYHTLVLLDNGEVVGLGTLVPAAASHNVKQVACSYITSFALLTNGTLVPFGDNSWNQYDVPQSAQGNIVQVAVGYTHAIALLSNGTVIGWGRNDAGQATVPLLAQSNVVQIAANNRYSAALLSTGRVVVWGEISVTPSKALSGVTTIAAAEYAVLAVGSAPCTGEHVICTALGIAIKLGLGV